MALQMGFWILAVLLLLVGMGVLPLWVVRTYATAARRPGGRRLLAWYVVAWEALLASCLLQFIADRPGMSEQDASLLLSLLESLLAVGGLVGVLRFGMRLYHVQRQD